MTRPHFLATKNDLNAYIDHLEWKMTHKDENIKSLSAQCDAYAKSLKRNHQITQNLIDNVTASLPVLSPGTSNVTTSEIKKNDNNTISEIIGHIDMGKNFRIDASDFIRQYEEKYGKPFIHDGEGIFIVKSLGPDDMLNRDIKDGFVKLPKEEISTIHKAVHMSIPLYPGVRISQYQNILNVLKPEIIEETQEQNDIPTYKVIIILVVYVIICILIVILVSASKNK